MSLPARTFPTSVDQPIVQDANFDDDKEFRAYQDAQILALEAAVLGGSSSVSSLPTPPTGIGYYLLKSSAGPAWAWALASIDDLAPAFAISSFTGAQSVECGAAITNPAFAAAYSSLPTSASLTNGDSIDSPLVLVTPFTSGTVVGTFSKNAVNAGTTPTAASTAFLLTAIGATTKTAGLSFLWLPRSFAGIGTAGATSSSASGNTAVLAGATGTLATNALLSSPVGASFGPFSPSAQKIYLQVPHTTTPHTFKDQDGFGFPMTVSTYSFTNQHAAALNTDLYESSILLSTPFTVTVFS
jgi:hypothetical protein